ncbi:MAG: arginine--tRNA ligase [Clostridiales bacterium]|nr:arginine--tRNA ligase [Clostridiales bacterium]
MKTRIKTVISDAVAASIVEAFPALSVTADEIYKSLEYPPDKSMGDISFPCFKFSRTLRCAPNKIAAAVSEKIESSGALDGTSSVSVAGGYVNFTISADFLGGELLPEILAAGADYGRSREGEGKTVVIDYSSPNVAKPFHIGHLGTTVIGHSIKLLHQFCGYNCVGINHLGDWGTQFGKMIVAYRLWGDREKIEAGGIDELVALYVKFHEEAERDPSLDARAREEFHKLETGDAENLELWQWFKGVSLKEYGVTYRQLGIEFDSWNGESFYTDKMPAEVEKLREKGLLKLDDGASIVDLSEYNMPPCLILKSDGSTLYPTRDIAAAVYRAETYHFDKCIYVTSAGQSLHFAQWFRVVELMGYPWYDRLVHVPYGTVSIGGEKLATRTGNVILLKDLFALAIEKVSDIITEKNPSLSGEEKSETAEAVGVGAIVFYYLSSGRIRDINFNIDDALNFEGNTGPYAMYTYARTCSVMRKAEAEEISPSGGSIENDEERSLILTLSRFGEAVSAALDEYEPSHVTRYILDLCADFNRFYHDCPILTADDEKTASFRVGLTAAAGNVLKSALSLICLKTPEKI